VRQWIEDSLNNDEGFYCRNHLTNKFVFNKNERTGLEEISVKKNKKKMLKPRPVSKPRAIQSLIKLPINSIKRLGLRQEHLFIIF
jgi:hypothetical protein